MKRLHLLPLLGTAFLGLAGATAWADTITFYNTGVANDGSVLAAGTADSHYSMVYSSDSSSTTATATAPNPAWQQNSATAGWIGPGSDGNQGWASGYYAYETTLDLTGYDPTTASLSGTIAADDNVYIYLNEAGPVLYSGSGFSAGAPFLLNSGFISGLNLVDFVIYNQSGPSGLLVDDTLATANADTPEPGTLFLLVSGTAVGTFHALRKSRTRSGEPLAGA